MQYLPAWDDGTAQCPCEAEAALGQVQGMLDITLLLDHDALPSRPALGVSKMVSSALDVTRIQHVVIDETLAALL